MKDLTKLNFESMTHAEFEEYLPEFFAAGSGRVSQDPRLRKFLDANPECAALVSDLETIAEHARSLFENDPSDNVWSNIEKKLKAGPEPEET